MTVGVIESKIRKEVITSARLLTYAHAGLFIVLTCLYFLAQRNPGSGISDPGAKMMLEFGLAAYAVQVCCRIWAVKREITDLYRTHILLVLDFTVISFIAYAYKYAGNLSNQFISLETPALMLYLLFIVINGVSHRKSIILASLVYALFSWAGLSLVVFFDPDFALSLSRTGMTIDELVEREVQKFILLASIGFLTYLSSLRFSSLFSSSVKDLSHLLVLAEEREVKLDELNSKLRNALEMKNRFLSRVSHELRTPINIIMGKLQNTDVEHDVVEHANDLLEMVDNLITLNEIRENDFKREEFNPILLLDNSIDQFSLVGVDSSIEQKSNNIDLNDCYVGYKIIYKRIYNILIGNALKHTRSEKIAVSLNYHEEKDSLEIAVTDQGDGCQSELMKVYGLSSGWDANANAGLGYSTLREILSLLGGSIRFENLSVKGLKITVTIPTTKVRKKAPISAHQQSVNGSVNPKILIVDDTPSNLMITKTMVKKAGYDHDTASDGREALEMVEKVKYDLILMDCMMPVMDGYQATREIRSKYSEKVPIIALTAHALQSDREKALEAGMNDHLTKPVSFQELEKTVAYYLSTNKTA